MCGIIGYIGNQRVLPILLEGLRSLEYRGYDSGGLAIIDDGNLRIFRSAEKIVDLENKINADIMKGPANIGIGHTRWATHGRPCEINCHPHSDCQGEIAVVHNGIIENYLELREQLENKGHKFLSQTDTEVLPHLLEEAYQGDLLQAMQQVLPQLRGSYATVAICREEPDTLVAAKKDSLLVIGIGDGEYFLASDISALVEHTRKVIIMEDHEIALLTREGVTVYKDGQKIDKEPIMVDWDYQAAKKGGYDHFMIKEINEQPEALRQTLKGHLADDLSKVMLPELKLEAEQWASFDKIVIVGCGTAYHAGLVAKYTIEKLLRIPVVLDVASEFRYKDPLVDQKTLLLVISQSGETADTLAALREGKERGAYVTAITNVVGSTIAREADEVIYTWAGPEISIASTKAYLTQLLAVYLFTLYLAQSLEKLAPAQIADLVSQLAQMPQKVEEALDLLDQPLQKVAKDLKKRENAFFMGRGLDYAVALEGSLKLKEVSYIHAEAYAAGELKHGTLALITEETPLIVLCTQHAIMEKTISNIKEVKARDAQVVVVACSDMKELEQVADSVIYLPPITDELAPLLAVIPLQLLAYYTAKERGCNIDQPRNLAKSVTVE
ncbi:MAG: glutamine--fructose-6-phosphate transaminase (isomerizing) [Bacillota bacterium]|jgi:glucosamine--fructose-6-phosphate aminotransferase (isomerizing)